MTDLPLDLCLNTVDEVLPALLDTSDGTRNILDEASASERQAMLQDEDHSGKPGVEDRIPLRATAKTYAFHAICAPVFRDTALVRATAVTCMIHIRSLSRSKSPGMQRVGDGQLLAISG